MRCSGVNFRGVQFSIVVNCLSFCRDFLNFGELFFLPKTDKPVKIFSNNSRIEQCFFVMVNIFLLNYFWLVHKHMLYFVIVCSPQTVYLRNHINFDLIFWKPFTINSSLQDNSQKTADLQTAFSNPEIDLLVIFFVGELLFDRSTEYFKIMYLYLA
jgi:hypothetical protein